LFQQDAQDERGTLVKKEFSRGGQGKKSKYVLEGFGGESALKCEERSILAAKTFKEGERLAKMYE